MKEFLVIKVKFYKFSKMDFNMMIEKVLIDFDLFVNGWLILLKNKMENIEKNMGFLMFCNGV